MNSKEAKSGEAARTSTYATRTKHIHIYIHANQSDKYSTSNSSTVASLNIQINVCEFNRLNFEIHCRPGALEIFTLFSVSKPSHICQLMTKNIIFLSATSIIRIINNHIIVIPFRCRKNSTLQLYR